MIDLIDSKMLKIGLNRHLFSPLIQPKSMYIEMYLKYSVQIRLNRGTFNWEASTLVNQFQPIPTKGENVKWTGLPSGDWVRDVEREFRDRENSMEATKRPWEG
jgi:hypothetical protein